MGKNLRMIKDLAADLAASKELEEEDFLTRDYQTAYMGNSSRELPYRPANMGVAPPIWGFTRKLARHSLELHIELTLPNTTIHKIHCN